MLTYTEDWLALHTGEQIGRLSMTYVNVLSV